MQKPLITWVSFFQRQGKLEKAIEACNTAIAIKPDYADAYWNLSGTAGSIGEAKNWIEKFLKADPNHLKAKLALSALKFYEGDKSDFNELMNSALKDHEFMRSLGLLIYPNYLHCIFIVGHYSII